jgi:hypothetical protein
VTFASVGEIGERPGDIRRALELLATRPPRRPDPAVVERFSARASAGTLARILDRTIATPGRIGAHDARERHRHGDDRPQMSVDKLPMALEAAAPGSSPR